MNEMNDYVWKLIPHRSSYQSIFGYKLNNPKQSCNLGKVAFFNRNSKSHHNSGPRPPLRPHLSHYQIVVKENMDNLLCFPYCYQPFPFKRISPPSTDPESSNSAFWSCARLSRVALYTTRLVSVPMAIMIQRVLLHSNVNWFERPTRRRRRRRRVAR